MKLIIFSISLYLLKLCYVNASSDLQITTEFTEEDVFLINKYKKMEIDMKNIVKQGVRYLMGEFSNTNGTIQLSPHCVSNILKITSGVRSLHRWALNFLDASGKISDGYLEGNLQMLGNYDQCLATAATTKNGDVEFRGKYCLVSYSPFFLDPQKNPDRMKLLEKARRNIRNVTEVFQTTLYKWQEASENINVFYGMCVPSGCSQKDISNLTNYVGDMIHLNVTVLYCETEDERYLHTRQIVIICIFSFFLLLGVIGSALEYYYQQRNVQFKSMPARVLLCFSITTNFPKLINTETSEETLACIHGIRILSTFYAILTHTIISKVLLPIQSDVKTNIVDYMPAFFFQILANAILPIEVFFVMSGLLNAYLRVMYKKKGMSFSLWEIIIHRLWRIFPVYIASILLLYLFIPRGPLATYYTENFIERCNTEWWKNFLFINNFYGYTKCFVQSWYIACDSQLFLISLVTVPILMKSPKTGIVVNAAVIFGGLIGAAIWSSIKEIQPALLVTTRRTHEEFLLPYMSPLSHASSYFLGILLGYILAMKKEFKISKVSQIVGWIMASTFFTSMLFMTYRWQSGDDYTTAESVLYLTFSKPLYALSVGWMMFCCITGHGGIIKYILSLKFWIPLSRSSYAIYLISMSLQLFYVANLRRTVNNQWMAWIWTYAGDVTISCLLAMTIVVLVEMPMVSLEKLIFKDRKFEKKTESSANGAVNMKNFQENNAYDVTTDQK